MKPSFILSALLGVFFLFSAHTVQAQEGLKNGTSCKIVFKYRYGPTGTCTQSGSGTITLLPGTSVSNVTPAGTSFIQVKGVDSFNACATFNVGESTCGFSTTAGVTCPVCNGYTATYIPGSGVKVN